MCVIHAAFSVDPQCMCSMLSNKKRLCGASDPAESCPYQNEGPFILLRKAKESSQVKSSQVKSSQVKSSQVHLSSCARPRSAQAEEDPRRRNGSGSAPFVGVHAPQRPDAARAQTRRT